MIETWILLIIGVVLLFTKAYRLGLPYIFASAFYICLDYFYEPQLSASSFVAIFCGVDYMCARYCRKQGAGIPTWIFRVLLLGVLTHAMIGIDIVFNTNIVYDRYEVIIQSLNIIQMMLLISGGYSAGWRHIFTRTSHLVADPDCYYSRRAYKQGKEA